MAKTPAQIRKERKDVLRTVRKSLNDLDSMIEQLQRLIQRVLKLKKQLPDIDDATAMLTQIRTIDKQLDQVFKDTTTFSTFVRTT